MKVSAGDRSIRDRVALGALPSRQRMSGDWRRVVWNRQHFEDASDTSRLVVMFRVETRLPAAGGGQLFLRGELITTSWRWFRRPRLASSRLATSDTHAVTRVGRGYWIRDCRDHIAISFFNFHVISMAKFHGVLLWH